MDILLSVNFENMFGFSVTFHQITDDPVFLFRAGDRFHYKDRISSVGGIKGEVTQTKEPVQKRLVNGVSHDRVPKNHVCGSVSRCPSVSPHC
jgi:hypothetical protein